MTLNLTEPARELRKQSTEAERLLWNRIRAKQVAGFKFRRQEQIGRFIVDFVCYQKSLIIEADGSQHAVEVEKDNERTLWLNAQGFHVLRFWNNEILTNINGVLAVIQDYLDKHPPLPDPLPQRGEGEGQNQKD